MLGTIGVQPSELTSIVDLAKTSLSQLLQNVNTQNALLQGGFTGDAMTPEARARWMGTPSVADGDTSLGEGGYAADAAMRAGTEARPLRHRLMLHRTCRGGYHPPAGAHSVIYTTWAKLKRDRIATTGRIARGRNNDWQSCL